MGLFGGLKDAATMVVGKEKADELAKKAEEGLNKAKEVATEKIGEDKLNLVKEGAIRAYDELCARNNNLTYKQWMEVKAELEKVSKMSLSDQLALVGEENYRDTIEMFEAQIEGTKDAKMRAYWENLMITTKLRAKGICPNCDTENSKLVHEELEHTHQERQHSHTNIYKLVSIEDWKGTFTCSNCNHTEVAKYQKEHKLQEGPHV